MKLEEQTPEQKLRQEYKAQSKLPDYRESDSSYAVWLESLAIRLKREKDEAESELASLIQIINEEYPLCQPREGCGKCDRIREFLTLTTKEKKA